MRRRRRRRVRAAAGGRWPRSRRRRMLTKTRTWALHNAAPHTCSSLPDSFDPGTDALRTPARHFSLLIAPELLLRDHLPAPTGFPFGAGWSGPSWSAQWSSLSGFAAATVPGAGGHVGGRMAPVTALHVTGTFCFRASHPPAPTSPHKKQPTILLMRLRTFF